MSFYATRIGLAMMLIGSQSYAYLTDTFLSFGNLCIIVGMSMIWLGIRKDSP